MDLLKLGHCVCDCPGSEDLEGDRRLHGGEANSYYSVNYKRNSATAQEKIEKGPRSMQGSKLIM